MANKKIYKTKDCYPIKDANEKEVTKSDDKLLRLIEQTDTNNSLISIFHLGNKKMDDDTKVVYFDKGKWIAGRYIGKIESKEMGSLSIAPRFGEKVLMEMFSEIFHIRLFENFNSNSGNQGIDGFLKLLVCIIWQEKLLSAMRYGFPRKEKNEICKGYGVKGKLLVQPSLLPYLKENKVVSQRKIIGYDETIIGIIYRAYRILINDYNFVTIHFNSNVYMKNTLNELEKIASGLNGKKISEKEYLSIRYSRIYQGFSEIVDFSWQIINSRKGVGLETEKNALSGFLIDMAEVWEAYTRTIIQRISEEYKWKLVNNEYIVYKGAFFERRIIPDIVLERNGEYCVLDAKYKKMIGDKNDLDREDFFQIHAYTSYFQNKSRVCVAGLLYPMNQKTSNVSEPLFGDENTSGHVTKFIIAGPIVDGESIDNESFTKFISGIIGS